MLRASGTQSIWKTQKDLSPCFPKTSKIPPFIESQIKQIKLCILPAFTHSFPNYQELLIVASSLVNLQVDLTDARCLWARSQVQNRATKGENPSLMCSRIKEESSNFQVKVNRSPIKGTLQRNRIQLRIAMKMWK